MLTKSSLITKMSKMADKVMYFLFKMLTHFWICSTNSFGSFCRNFALDFSLVCVEAIFWRSRFSKNHQQFSKSIATANFENREFGRIRILALVNFYLPTTICRQFIIEKSISVGGIKEKLRNSKSINTIEIKIEIPLCL